MTFKGNEKAVVVELSKFEFALVSKAVEEYDKRHKRLDPFSVMYYETLVPLKNATKDVFADERHRKDVLNYFYDSEDLLDESYADFGFNEPEL